MARFFPKSLLGQSLLAIAVTLLIGQAVSGLLLYRAAQDRRDAATVNAAAFHLLRMVNRETDSPRDIRRALRRAEPEGRIDIGRGRGERRRGLPPRLSGMIADASPLLPGERRAAGEEAQLREILARQGVSAEALVVTIRPVAQDTLLASLADEFPRFRARWRDGLSEREVMVAALRMPGESRWIVARALRPPLEAGVLWLIAAQTVLLFLVLLAATYLVLRRITRPLARLTERVERFARTHEAREPLPERGPEDVSRLIAAHNLLEHRIAALLDEKDVMLGAIGHDLKTPLAALRVRIESVTDETQRARMAERYGVSSPAFVSSSPVMRDWSPPVNQIAPAFSSRASSSSLSTLRAQRLSSTVRVPGSSFIAICAMAMSATLAPCFTSASRAASAEALASPDAAGMMTIRGVPAGRASRKAR